MTISWIDADELDRHVDTLRGSAQRAIDQAGARRVANVVDPFASVVVASTYDASTPDELARVQNAESGLRGMSNALGKFHQSVLASVAGWTDHDAGYDLECPERRLLAEVKNKWNTMNAANRREVEADLQTAIRQKSGVWEAYLVLIVPKRPDRYTRLLAPRVSEIDGASFYHLVTGQSDAIHDLFDHLCDALAPATSVAEHCRAVLAQSLPPRQAP